MPIPTANDPKHDFIRQIIRDDLAKNPQQQICTRFPPEPNGYLHIGHAKSICLNFGIAAEFSGRCHLRLDDTNPTREERIFAQAIAEDVQWLGFKWAHLCHASNYFQVYYLSAKQLIQKGKAYVCDLTPEQMRAYRGTLTEPGRNSPWRERSMAENLALFERMRAGEFADGSRTLRAKIDMAHGNINLRDPALYRIKKQTHLHTGDTWPIYPMYDFAHALGDAIEGITHSLCTLEFEDHRPLYDWCVDQVDLAHNPHLLEPLRAAGHHWLASRPKQIEFSRLNINYTLMSKRKLTALVEENVVAGWDDPRMYTIQGLRRRGYTPSAIRLFVERIGISKQNSVIDYSTLENCLREDLDNHARRRLAVVNPLKLVLVNIPENHEEHLTLPNHPKQSSAGSRQVPFGRELWIEQSDFSETPPKGWKRLVLGGEVRLRGAGIIRIDQIVRYPDGTIAQLLGWLDPQSRPGLPGANRKVKGTIHWVSAAQAIPALFRLYDRLFNVAHPDDQGGPSNYAGSLNPHSQVDQRGFIEPAGAKASPEDVFQFERQGYFVADRYEHTHAAPVFNRSVTLRDTWQTGSTSINHRPYSSRVE